MREIDCYASEGRSNVPEEVMPNNMVRIFLDNDYSYGYFVCESEVLTKLSEHQKEAYFKYSRLKVTVEQANYIVENGATIQQKRYFIEQ